MNLNNNQIYFSDQHNLSLRGILYEILHYNQQVACPDGNRSDGSSPGLNDQGTGALLHYRGNPTTGRVPSRVRTVRGSPDIFFPRQC